MTRHAGGAPISDVRVGAYRVPTERPESDGTLEWDATVLVVVEISAAGHTGLGYTYADAAAAHLVRDRLTPQLLGREALDIPARRHDMAVAMRNLGTRGLGALAASAVDVALWDVKGRLFDRSLAALLGRAREDVAAYGSGGFTSASVQGLQRQLGGWAAEGLTAVKMKVGRDKAGDLARVAAAREAIGADVALFMDANGAFSQGSDRKQALAFAWQCAEHDVRWFEEPVSSDDRDGLRLLRDRAPPGMAISAGEYGWELADFADLLQAGAVDVLQADATRCGGVSGFLEVASLCTAAQVPLSTHCAPALHTALACAAQPVVHLEHFHDHARLERLLFDGVPELRHGRLAADTTRPGLGLEFKRKEARCFML